MRPNHKFSLIVCALCPLCLTHGARAQNALHPQPPIAVTTQQRINEVASYLERAQRLILEGAALRQKGERFPDYLERLSRALPGETDAQRAARIEGYLNTLTWMTNGTASARRMPALRDESATNRVLWQHATHLLSYMPSRVAKLRTAWKQERGKQERGKQERGVQALWRQEPLRTPARGQEPDAFPAEFVQTLQMVTAAYNALRDARP